MKITLMRNEKEVKLIKKCPVCNSSRFKRVQNPIESYEGFVKIAECKKCNYSYQVRA